MSQARIQIPEAFAPLFTPSRHKAFYGGRGGAKSHSFARAIIARSDAEPLRVLHLREIQKSIKDSAKLLLEDTIKLAGFEREFTALESEIRHKNGGRHTFAGLRTNPDALKSAEGVDIAIVWEAAPVSQRSIDLLIPTIRKPGSEIWWEWNPENEFDPVDRMFRNPKGPPPDSIVRMVGWQDNPWFPEVLRVEKDHLYRIDPDKAEHVWGGGYVKAIDGAYFAHQLRTAREEGRITRLAIDPMLQRRAFWDLGVRDHTAIWVAQFVGDRINVIDYIEASGQPLDYYVQTLRDRGHKHALCVLPHDGVNQNAVTALRFEDHVRSAGFDVQVVRNQGKGAAMQRVEAARRLFPRIWFDIDATRAGLRALGAYHERRDHDRNIGLGPEHDWASHGADAFGLMCIAYTEPMRYDDRGDYDFDRRTASSVSGY